MSEIPEQIGKYRIDRRLGRGGMGEVYQGYDTELERPVALKFVSEENWEDERAQERFRLEAKAVAALNHSSIVQIYDLLHEEGRQVLVMELIEGESLRQLLQRKGRLSIDRALRLAGQIAEGLAATHEKGILHRDLKPGNIMIAEGSPERAKLLDFGLAKDLDGNADLTLESGIVGTVTYMSPEQARAQEIDARSDLFSLGVVIYEMLSGISPFAGRDIGETLTRICNHWPDPLHELDPKISKSLSTSVYRLLQKDPALRPSSAAETAEWISSYQSHRRSSVSVNVDSGEMTIDLRSGPVGADAARSVLRALLVCEPAGDGRLSRSLGDERATALRERHDKLARDLLLKHGGFEAVRDGGFLMLFDRPVQAAACALELHDAVARLADEEGVEFSTRAAIHLGEMLLKPTSSDGAFKVEGLAKSIALILLSLSQGGQTLLTRGAFDLARHGAKSAFAQSEDLQWIAHGVYRLKGPGEIEIFEVVRGQSVFQAPEGTERAQRAIVQDVVPGWRPAPGLSLPADKKWTMAEKVGEGGVGEVWLARSQAGDRHVFKFCWDVDGLRSLQREVTLFRLLKEELGSRDDIAKIVGWNLEEAPYYLEAEYTESGNLAEWLEAQGGFTAVSIETRLEIVAQVAEALAASHAVGVLHKDVKPANILIRDGRDGPRAQLTDFGIGRLVDPERLGEVGFTVLGMTEIDQTATTEAIGSGTRLYMAPEIIEGKTATLQADIYALGATLYQLIAEDFSRAVASGWERDVDDEILREDLALAVDGSPQRRLADAAQLADRLRNLETRREEHRKEASLLEEARRAQQELQEMREKRRWLATISGILFLALLAVFYFFLDAREATRQAEQEAETSERALRFVEDVFTGSDPYQQSGAEVTLDSVLESGRRQLENELKDQPEIRARLQTLIGRVYYRLSEFSVARDLLEEATELRRTLDAPLALALSLEYSADVDISQSRFATAEKRAREALQIRGDHGETPSAVAASLCQVAEILHYSNQYREAEELLRKAIDLSLDPSDSEMLECERRLAELLVSQGRFQEAEEYFREILRRHELHLGEDHPDVADLYDRLGGLYREIDRLDESAEEVSTAMEIRERVFGRGHSEYAESLNSLGLVRRAQGELQEAESLFLRSLEIRKKAGGETVGVAQTLENLALVAEESEKYEESARLYGESLEIYRELFSDQDNFMLARAMHNAAFAEMGLGRLEKAEKLLYEARDMTQRLEIPVAMLGDIMNTLGVLHFHKGEPETAVDRLKEALEIRISFYGEESALAADVHYSLASMFHVLKDDRQCAAEATKASAAYQASGRPVDVEDAESLLDACAEPSLSP